MIVTLFADFEMRKQLENERDEATMDKEEAEEKQERKMRG